MERERMARAQAGAQVVKDLVPNISSHPRIITGEAEDAGGIDELKNSNFPAEMLFPFIYGRMRAKNDKCRAWANICDMLERGLPSIGGGRANMIRDISIAGLSGGGKGDKVLKHNGILSRTFRGKPEYEETEAKDEE
jgi:hypothetical protein